MTVAEPMIGFLLLSVNGRLQRSLGGRNLALAASPTAGVVTAVAGNGGGGNRLTRVKRAIFVAPFGELADPRLLADLAAAAEERGWDGFFVWDHVAYRAPVRAVADPWVALAAVACATSRVRIGPMVTPVSRRRVHKLARETVTLDLLSSGRLTFGVGLGSARNNELEPFGEVVDPRERARLLDQGLDDLVRYWAGEFEPAPVQKPRIPVWVAAEWPHRRPVRRALRWDGVFPIGLPGPEALAELVGEIGESRPAGDPFDVVVGVAPDLDPGPWERAGATWTVTDFGIQPTRARVRAVIDAGPG
jgi:alkanesulfonate monooxygenase SsuD/methylene tetrahydromethanopterin reductase-like flavin-dependent oxidoreductase (luciferase family)